MGYARYFLRAALAFLVATHTVTVGDASGRRGAVPGQPDAGLSASGWPKDRGDAANTGRSGARAARGQLKWVFQGRLLVSSPIIGANGVVYVGSADHTIYALDELDGREREDFEAGVRQMDAQEDRDALHAAVHYQFPYRGQHGAYFTPAIGRNGVIYVGSDNNQFYALNGTTGRKIWAFRTRDYEGGTAQTVGTDGTVYVGCTDHNIYALDGTTGSLRWKFQANDEADFTPALGPEGTLYIASRDTFVYAIDGRNGKSRWKFGASDVFHTAIALGPSGLAYAACKNGYIYSLDSSSGRERWAFRLHGEIYDDPAVDSDGTVYVIVDSSSGTRLYALNGHTGYKMWAVRLYTGGASITLAADKTVYVASDKLYAIDGRTGRTRWAFDAHSPIGPSPAIGADGTVYFTTENGRVYAIR